MLSDATFYIGTGDLEPGFTTLLQLFEFIIENTTTSTSGNVDVESSSNPRCPRSTPLSFPHDWDASKYGEVPIYSDLNFFHGNR